MAENQFSVSVPNPLQALMLGEQGYKDARSAAKDSAISAAREQAAQEVMQGGDPKNALARLLSVGDDKGASTLATVLHNQQTAEHQKQSLAQTGQYQGAQIANMEAQRRLQEQSLGQAGSYQNAQIENMREQRRLQEVDLLRKGDGLEGQIEQRKRAALSEGIDPSSPAFQSFVLTGKMPREDQQPLSATDKKAILEADEGVMAGQAAVEALQKAKTLSPKAYTGPTASMRGYATSLVGSEAGEATAELENVVTANALTQMKAIFGGNPTEGERQILLDIQGSSKLPDAVRQKIFDRAIIAANRRLEFNKQRAASMRGGTFYKPSGPPAASMNLTSPGNTVTGVEVTDMPPLPSGFQLVK